MNLPYAAAFGLMGGLGGLLVHYGIERADPRNSRIERRLTVVFSAIVSFLLCLKFQASGRLAAVYAILALVLIGTSVFDLRKQVIPHALTLPGIAAGLVLSTWILPVGFKNALAGALAGAGILLFTTIVEAMRRKEVGGGDWKLAAAIGSFLGVRSLIVAMLFAGLFGLTAGAILLFKGAPSKPAALGPYIGAGAIAALLWN